MPRSPLAHLFARNPKSALDAHPSINSQAALARRMGAGGRKVGQATVSRLLSGDQSPTLDMVGRAAAALGYKPWQLLVEGFAPARPPQIQRDATTEATLRNNVQSALLELDNYLRGRESH